jgi:tetratricopeptide (TPR) repeat protein
VSFAARALAARVFSVAAVLGTLLLAPPAAGQEASLAQLADRYRRGDRDTALDEIGLWTAERTQREVEALLQPARLRLRSFDPANAFSAALLHVHRALLGSANTLDYRSQHLAAATRLVLAAADAPVSPGSAGLARRMFLLVGLALEETLDVGAAHEVVRAGLERFEDDPELLTVLGVALETGPSMRTYDLPPGARRRSFDARQVFTVEGGGSRGEWRSLPDSTLGQAEAVFRRALAADPGLGEARLRLGRVRLLRGRFGEAIVDLQQVARGDGSLRRRYLASLFEARAHEKRGDLEAAVRAYRAAVAVEPEGQAAWVGLGRALDLLGRRDEAQEAFVAVLGIHRERGDPWLSYTRGDLERIEPLVAELQAALAR